MSNRRLKLTVRDLIYYLYSETLVPELFQEFGEEQAIRFIQLFGGMRIEVPSYKRIQELQRNIDIYESMLYVPSEDTVRQLAERYHITTVWVREIYKKMRRRYPDLERYMATLETEPTVHVTTHREPRYGVTSPR